MLKVLIQLTLIAVVNTTVKNKVANVPQSFKTKDSEPSIHQFSYRATQSMYATALINDAIIVVFLKTLNTIISLADQSKHIIHSQVLCEKPTTK